MIAVVHKSINNSTAGAAITTSSAGDQLDPAVADRRSRRRMPAVPRRRLFQSVAVAADQVRRRGLCARVAAAVVRRSRLRRFRHRRPVAVAAVAVQCRRCLGVRREVVCRRRGGTVRRRPRAAVRTNHGHGHPTDTVVEVSIFS